MTAADTFSFVTLRRDGVRLIGAVQQFFTTQFGRNLRAFGSAEIIKKISRILAMVFIARTVSVEEMGFAAVALTSYELICILTANGIGQMIVRANDNELESVCRRAHQLNFIVCFFAGVFQIAVGYFLAQAMDAPALFNMSLWLSLVYFGMGFGLVRIFRAMRRNRMDRVARIQLSQVSADNIFSLVLALLGFGAWALVLPKVLTFPIWLIGALRSDNWRPNMSVAPAPLRSFRVFCLPVLATEALKGLRLHVDKAVIAALLGVEALGLYFFAINAGLGLAHTLSVAFSACLFPQLCNTEREGRSAVDAWTKAAIIFVPGALLVSLCQAGAALFYVPFIFGEVWREAAPLVGLLCLAAAPRFLAECANQLARVRQHTLLETATTMASFVVSIGAIAIGAIIGGIFGAAIGLVAAAWAVEPALAAFIRHRAKA